MVRATSHTRLRAPDHHTSSTFIGGKAEPVQGRFTLCLRDQWSMWVQDGCKVLHGMEWIMFHGHLDYFSKPSLGGRSSTKPGIHGIMNAHNHWFILFYDVWGTAWIEIHWNSISLRAWSRMTSHYTLMILEVFWDGLWTPSFGLSQFHSHGSWLMCDVALRPSP